MREMNQLCTSGVNENASVAGDEPAKRVSGDVQAAAAGGCFDCSICLDFSTEPVVTLCGHLYCWPCIYEWLHPDVGADASNGARRFCPVCKAAVTLDRLVPLYGRGGGSSKKPPRGSAIPRRPIVHRREAVDRQSDQSSDGGRGHRHGNTGHNQQDRLPWRAHHHVAAAPPRFDVFYPPPPTGGGMSMFPSTSVGVLGGMALAVLPPWVSRGQAPAYYPSPYHHMSARMRRQHMEVERSLHQIWFFLVVSTVLCLLLF
ncbi:hypothetical protein GUJ93_ZPchr0002g26812 [Zizania palustris]|uniref:E3 ubiquitin-protein ligase RMA n=1 Tax=Zizania palustris TaxID=103762 RepID=A0A8J5V530_ZIZPA|nr:hypothetical protein GUJ93_ZPchr0002g26812 [Zizania palustris]